MRSLVRWAIRDMELREEAEDIYQTVMFKLLCMSDAQVGGINNLASYLLVMIRHEASRIKLKEKGRRLNVSIEEEEAVANDEVVYSDKFKELWNIEAGILLREIMESLSESEAKILQLLIIGYNAKQIADTLKVSHNAARQKVHRLRNKLQELIFKN